jgi:hypothetical protein
VTSTVAIRSSSSAHAYLWTQVLFLGLILIIVAAILRVGALPYTAFAFSGTFLIFLTFAPSTRDVGISLALGAAFGLVYLLHHGAMSPYFGSALSIPGGFLGIGATQLLIARWIWASPANKRQALCQLGQACIVPVLVAGSMVAVAVAARLTPQTYDPVIYAFDTRFGTPPSWAVAALFQHYPWLFTSCIFVYNSLPLALSTCLALQWRARTNPFDVDVGLAVLVLGVVGFMLYQLCPVSGPIFLFPSDFPSRVPALLQAAQSKLPPVPRNGMPSLHVAWALLLLWNLRRHRVLFFASAWYALWTILATLGSGQHYLADSIVAPALVLAVQAGCGGVRAEWRQPTLVLTSVIIVGWLLAFRTGAALAIPAGSAAWAATGISLLLPVALALYSAPRASRLEGLAAPT